MSNEYEVNKAEFENWLIEFKKKENWKEIIEKERDVTERKRLYLGDPTSLKEVEQILSEWSTDCFVHAFESFLYIEGKETDEETLLKMFRLDKAMERAKNRDRKHALDQLEKIAKKYNLKSLIEELKERVSLES